MSSELTVQQWVLIGLGSVVVLKAVLAIAKTVNKFVFRSERNLRRLGEWAVVTGSTDGIGKAYAFELAARGINLVLVSRSADKLATVASELASLSRPVEVRTVAIDLSRPVPGYLDPLTSAIEGLEVGILINNAGVSHDHPDYLESYSEESLIRLVDLNAASVALVTRAVVPGMKARRRGLVLSLSSGAAEVPSCPLLSTYAASKAFVDAFTASMRKELAAFGISVEAPCALFVSTNMTKNRRPRRDIPSAITWARASLRQAGHGDAGGFPYYYHAWLGFLLKSLPRTVAENTVLKTNLATRAAYYRKEARKAAEAQAKAKASEEQELPEEPKKDL